MQRTNKKLGGGRLLWAPVFALMLAGVGAHSASADDEVVANKTFDDGIRARDAKDWKTACEMFDRSQKAAASYGALFNLGECNDHLGNTATAWSNYKAAESFARRNNDKRADDAAAKAKAIEPKLSMITIVLPKGVTGVVVTRDGTDVTTSVGVEVPIDPGTHTFKISAPGFKEASVDVTIGTSAEKKTLPLPDLIKIETTSGSGGSTANPTGGAGGANATGGATTTTTTGSGGGEPDEPKKGMSGVMIGGFVVGGVGAAGLILGAIMGGVAVGAKGDVVTNCPNSTCSTQAGKDALSSAKTDATVATVGLVAGGVLAAGGAVMIIVGAVSGKKEAKASTGLYVVPSFSNEGAGALFGGSF